MNKNATNSDRRHSESVNTAYSAEWSCIFCKPSSVIIGAMALLVNASFADTASKEHAVSEAVQVRTIAIDGSISRLRTEELVDRLQDESNEELQVGPRETHIHAPAFELAFFPVDTPVQHLRRGPGLYFERRSSSPVMAELVSRGVAALPVLLEHLSDRRPTRITWPPFPQRYQGFEGVMKIGDYFEPRYADPIRQPKGISMDMSGRDPHLRPRISTHSKWVTCALAQWDKS
jgi:hypothetical protein